MTHPAIARTLLAILCAAQGLGTVAVDINRTHAANPAWTGHARFHVLWQTATVTLLACLELALLYTPLVPQRVAFFLAAALAALPMLGFFLALFFRSQFGATLADPKGIPPVRLALRRSAIRLDLNTVVEVFSLLLLAAVVLFYRISIR